MISFSTWLRQSSETCGATPIRASTVLNVLRRSCGRSFFPPCSSVRADRRCSAFATAVLSKLPPTYRSLILLPGRGWVRYYGLSHPSSLQRALKPLDQIWCAGRSASTRSCVGATCVHGTAACLAKRFELRRLPWLRTCSSRGHVTLAIAVQDRVQDLCERAVLL